MTEGALASTATLALAGGCWILAIHQSSGMDMGAATKLGSLAFFAAAWVSMMAAMMLPGAVPAVSTCVRRGGGLRAAPMFVGSYIVVWTLVGLAVYVVYRPHSTPVAGAFVVAAGVYELTPFKDECRRRCRESKADSTNRRGPARCPFLEPRAHRLRPRARWSTRRRVGSIPTRVKSRPVCRRGIRA